MTARSSSCRRRSSTEGAAPGAWARIVLPQVRPDRGWEGDEKTKITEKLRESMR